MKKIIIALLLLPFIVKGQVKIHKSKTEYWDASLKKATCCDSVFTVNGWLSANDPNEINTYYPYLIFTLKKSKRTGIDIKFEGQFNNVKYESQSPNDSVVFEFENNQRIYLIFKGSGIRFMPGTSFQGGRIEMGTTLNPDEIKSFLSSTLQKVYFFSSKNGNIQGELTVTFKDELMKSLQALSD